MVAIVFPGQGSQYVEMAKDFYDNFNIARQTFEEVEEYTKINLKKIIFEDKDNLLNLTNYTQVCIFTASLSIYNTLIAQNNITEQNIDYMFGHSLGEYTAIAASKKLSIKESVLTLKKRGELMNDSVEPNKTGMAALIGLNSNQVETIITENNIDLQIANDNSPIQVVVSGDIDEIDNKKNIFLENNIKKFIKLNVSAAFHSKYMLDAQTKLNKEIDNLKLKNNNIKIISNFNAQASNNDENILKALKLQMANRVRWTESIVNLSAKGETKIIEIGPGKVLSGLIKRISDSFDITSITKITDLDNNG